MDVITTISVTIILNRNEEKLISIFIFFDTMAFVMYLSSPG